MTATFFPTQQDFRQWLEENHKTKTELIVGFYRVGTKKPSVTWSESVDQALCFGWIDGVRNQWMKKATAFGLPQENQQASGVPST